MSTTLSSCASSSRVTPQELFGLIEGQSAPLILDVRSTWEYNSGHVPGAVHVPFYLTGFRKKSMPNDKGTPIVVYCEHGPRAGLAKLGLKIRGVSDVRYMKGHMQRWRKLELPLETQSNE